MNQTAILTNNVMVEGSVVNAPHLEHGDVSAEVDGVAARVRGVHR